MGRCQLSLRQKVMGGSLGCGGIWRVCCAEPWEWGALMGLQTFSTDVSWCLRLTGGGQPS